jgi:hypothetical protein
MEMRATDNLLLMALTLVMVLGRPSPALAQGRFSDLPETWSSPCVEELAAKGILYGYPDGTFGGTRAMTRWEFALALWRTTVWIKRELEKTHPLHAEARHPTAPSAQLWFADVDPESQPATPCTTWQLWASYRATRIKPLRGAGQ